MSVLMTTEKDFGKEILKVTLLDDEPEREAVLYFDADHVVHAMTNREYVGVTYAIAERLEAACAGIPRGSWAAIAMDNHHMWHAMFFALVKCGYNVLLLDNSFDDERKAGVLRNGDVKVLVTNKPAEYEGVLVLDFEQMVAEPLGEPAMTPIDEQEPWAEYLAYCTSGTTGSMSKIPVHSMEKLYESMTVCCDRLTASKLFFEDACNGRIAGKTGLVTIPLHHNYGFEFCLVFWRLRAKACFMNTMSVMDMLGAIKQLNVWMFPTVPLVWKTFFQIMVGKNGGATPEAYRATFGDELSVGISTGATLDPHIRATYAKLGLALCDAWGASETPFALMKAGKDSEANCFDVDMSPYTKRVELEDGTKAQYGVGEMCLKDGPIFKGYLTPEGLVPPEVDADGYVHTGDVFEVTEKGAYFLGRCKNMIVPANGKKVYPEELELKFDFLLSDAAQYRIIGLDNQPTLFVLPKPEGPSAEELLERIREVNVSLEIHKRVSAVYFANAEMPASMKGVLGNKLPADLEANPDKYSKVMLLKGRND